MHEHTGSLISPQIETFHAKAAVLLLHCKQRAIHSTHPEQLRPGEDTRAAAHQVISSAAGVQRL